jgi:two-component system, cell cycle sensor histidine kinase and response regulator CckA
MQNTENLRSVHPDQTVVLIAEDEVLIRNIARIALQNEGYFVLAACDGEEALTISRAYAGPIHMLLSDIKMPRMDGLELRKQILAERLGIKILLMSGLTDAQIEGTPLLRKPFVPSLLLDATRRLIERPILYRNGATSDSSNFLA